MKKLLLMVLLMVSSLAAFAANVEFKRTWVDDYGYQNDVYGRYVHVGFVINGCKGKKCTMRVYFKDSNDNYIQNSSGNRVSVSSDFTPNVDSSRWHDYRIFCRQTTIPSNAKYMQVWIYDSYNNKIGISGIITL